jgi:DME family drug/metabolite transporter
VRPSDRTGELLVLAAAVLWGTMGIAVRRADAAGVGVFEASAWRAGIAFAGMLGITLLTDPRRLRVPGRDLAFFAAYGFVSIALFFLAYFTAIRMSSVATAAILLYTAPAWVAVIARLVLGENLGARKGVALGLAFCGCLLVVRAYDPAALRLNLPGVLAGLASGLTYGLYSIFGKLGLRRYDPQVVLTYALGFGTGFLVLLGLAAGVPLERFSPHHVMRAAGPVLYLGVVITLLPQWLYITGLRYVSAARASLVATVEPVVAALSGYAVLGEGMHLPQILGGALVLAAVLLSRAEET